EQQQPAKNAPYYEGNLPPRDVQIENNWLGIKPNEEMPENHSAFGVSVFNGINTNIYRNRISYHEGSGIITSVNANNMQVIQNIIVANGIAGMPDAIRLEGIISDSLIKGNLICGNDGAGIYLFKPIGSTTITNNYIKFNSRSLRRSAVYLMGNDHKVIDNEITNQVGAGVTVAAYPQSIRNMITGNKFNALDGLSIDLTTTNNVGVQDFQYGDGVNPPRDSGNRKLDTGNAAINAPEFMSTDFYLLGDKVNIDGKADPNAQIDLYRVTNVGLPSYGSLYEYIGTTKTNEKGKFGISLNNVKIGAKISAIATLPEYGTSEPASIATVRSLDKSANTEELAVITELPKCTTPPPVAQVPPAENPPQIPPENPPKTPPENPSEIPPKTPPETPSILKIKVERNVHFALDKYYISKGSAKVLDKIVDILEKYPNLIIELHGHTDYRASNDYNQILGMNRSKSVRNYLLKKGISPSRMTIKSFGEKILKEPGNQKIDHARNRRVEIIFKDYQGIPIQIEDQESDLQLEKYLKMEN
ncbi:MAG TPA: OmpA family protein, partial [Allocoleopsis sp.]